MTTNIKSIDLFGVSSRDIQTKYTASCPGDSHVTRIDAEAPEYPGHGPIGVSGFQVHCSDGSPILPMNSKVHSQQPSDVVVSEFAGAVAPEGIKDAVVQEQVWLVQFGYAGAVAPASVAVPDGPVSWRQSESEFSDCLLKGLTMWGGTFVFSLQLQFDCRSPPPPPVLPQIAPTSPTSGLPMIVTTTLAQVASTPSPSASSVNTLSSSQVAPNQTPFTTTITFGSGPSATTIITVITPGVAPAPLTVTLPGGTAAIVITQVSGGGGAPATFAPVPGPPLVLPSSSTSFVAEDVVFLSSLIAVLCSAVAALAVVLTYLRMRQHSKPGSQRHTAEIELATVGPSIPDHERHVSSDIQQVDPPAYLVVPIPEPGPVQGVPNELAGKSVKADDGGYGEE